MAFKPYAEMTAEEKELLDLRALEKKTREGAHERYRLIDRMASTFYNHWICEDEKVTPTEMKLYFQRAWDAATVYVDGVKSQKPEELLNEED